MPRNINLDRMARWSWLALALMLACLLLAFLPLRLRDLALNEQVQTEWLQLQSVNFRETPLSGIPVNHLEMLIDQLNASNQTLEKTAPQSLARIQLDPNIRSQMQQSFQLIDYINEKLIRIESLHDMARQLKVKIADEVLDGFPEHTSDIKRPDLLWAQLEFAYQCLEYATRCRVATIDGMEFPEVRFHFGPEGGDPFLQEIPVKLRMTGSSAVIRQFLTGLSLLSDEAKALGLVESSPLKPSVFIGGILIRKIDPKNPDFIQLDLTCWGLVYNHS